ncbi:MAG: DUF3313 family protein [Betaproteobacteria bacterium]|nr:DUF3313 family protein [Betaproteobacteria bacterium]
MKILIRAAIVVLACLAGKTCLAQSPAASDAEGLVAIKARNVDRAWLLPGADFRPYTKVLLKNADVAFQKDWLRDMNSNRGARPSQVTKSDARKIVEAARSGFDEIWAQAFRSSGYAVVTSPGGDVLEVSPRVVDLYVNAPDVLNAAGTRLYTVEAGEATLRMDIRDSLTGTLLGRVADHRETLKTPRAQATDSVTNREQFAQMFAVWALVAAKGLQELKANSPLPETLQRERKPPSR